MRQSSGRGDLLGWNVSFSEPEISAVCQVHVGFDQELIDPYRHNMTIQCFEARRSCSVTLAFITLLKALHAVKWSCTVDRNGRIVLFYRLSSHLENISSLQVQTLAWWKVTLWERIGSFQPLVLFIHLKHLFSGSLYSIGEAWKASLDPTQSGVLLLVFKMTLLKITSACIGQWKMNEWCQGCAPLSIS